MSLFTATDTSADIDDGGRGLQIVHALCSEVEISNDVPGSVVRATLP